MSDIFTYIKEQETSYNTTPVPIEDGYEWSMKEHIRKSVLYRDSKFTQGANDGTRPYKNIIRRIRNFAIVAMNFDVKDIEPFVDNAEEYYKSFLTRKFHAKWARKFGLDTYIDKLVESYEDFGLTLSKHIKGKAPEAVPLQSVAFCDQTDILSGPICLKHQYSPAQLKAFEGNWGTSAAGATTTIDELITLARNEKTDSTGNRKTKTPGKFIEVYELDAMLPKAWLKKDGETVTEDDETTYSQQMHIVAFYKDDNNERKGVTLFKGKGDPNKYKAIKRDDVWGRACGFGGIEELFEPQVWTNYNMIRIQDMLDAASKMIGVTSDPGVATRNKITEMETGDWIVVKEGATAQQFNNQPFNLPVFENAVALWEQHAQGIGSAYDAQLGDSPSSGTPFKLQDAVIRQGKGLHDERKRRLSFHLGEIYRDWILQDLVREMSNQQQFMEELSLEEMEYVAKAIVDNRTYEMLKEKVLNGEEIFPETEAEYRQIVLNEFMDSGSTQFFEIVKDELKDLPVDVNVNIAGAQKDLGLFTDKLTNVFRMAIANPAIFQIPGIPKLFNQILQSSGLDEVNFTKLTAAAPPMPQQAPQQAQQLQPITT